ncbi:MFS family permease [Neisseria sp. HSC-16F19]|nr:MFS transporter [Neisseria sp. HSC-16F19]MCP2041300.1 MFS family permease [Neisseria sp. HSC-16F19]
MINLAIYRRLLSDRQLRRIVLHSVLPRLPLGMNSLGITLLVQNSSGSFAQAGWVAGAYMAAMAVQAALVGRWIDLRGPQGLLLPMAAGYALSMLLLVWVSYQGASLPWLMAAAGAAGLCFPPVSTLLRATFRKADMAASLRQSAYAVDSMIIESCFILGPLLLSLAVWLGSEAYAVMLSALLVAVGVPLFVRTGALQRWGQVETGVERHWLGPLQVQGVRRALVLSLLVTLGVGMMEIAMPAFAEAQGKKEWTGLFYAVMSVPSVVAVLTYGSRTWAMPLRRQIVLCLLWLTGGLLLMSQAASVGWFALGCMVVGMAIGPIFTMLALQLGGLSPSATVTEAFTWNAMLFTLGIGLGIWLGGLLVQAWGWQWPLWAGAAVTVLGVLWCPLIPVAQAEQEAPEAA